MRGGRFSIALCVGLTLGAIAAAPAGAIGFLGEWGGSGNGPGEFTSPASVAIGPGGSVYVADSGNNRIERFDEAGVFLGQWGGLGARNGQFATPQGVATDGTGNVYVIDKGNARVEKFDAAGAFLATWGRLGSGPGDFRSPEGVAVDLAGNVYVADTGNNRIEKFTSSGAFLEERKALGLPFGQLAGPEAVALDAAGNLYVAEAEKGRVDKFSAAGAFQRTWGPEGAGPRRLDLPIALAADGGRLFVGDAGLDKVVEFTDESDYVGEWGGQGSGPSQFSSPVGIAAEGGRVYVADAGNDRIQVFGALAPPQYGKTVNLSPFLLGIVRVRFPGSRRYVVLAAGLETTVPVGSIVDTTRGRVRLTSARSKAGGTQSADFFDGRFKVLQPGGGKPITVLKLENPVACGSKNSRASASRSHPRGLWGSGKGNFRSEGRHGSATVRGTIWWAQDRCDGTKFKVKRGVVTIRDFTNHTTVKLHKGETYLAPVG